MNIILETKHKSSDIRGMKKLPLKTRVQIGCHILVMTDSLVAI